MTLAGTNSAEYKGRTSDAYFNPVRLKPSTTYYWRVDEVGSAGQVTTGSVWHFATLPAPTVLRVDGSTNYANPTGASWTTCFSSLQAALNAVGAGNANHEIWVAQGTYKPTVPATPSVRNATFTLRSGVAIYGGFPAGGGDGTFGARMPAQYATILSGDIGTSGVSSDNCYHVVTATRGKRSSVSAQRPASRKPNAES